MFIQHRDFLFLKLDLVTHLSFLDENSEMDERREIKFDKFKGSKQSRF
jgi:hypothetical protein